MFAIHIHTSQTQNEFLIISHADHSISFTYNNISCCLLHRRGTSITPSLKSISPLFVGKINNLYLERVFINCTSESLLINSLISPHSSLLKLTVYLCSFSSGVYNRLITAIATSKLTYFATYCLDVTTAKVLATLLVDSKTLEEVEVIAVNKDVAVILAEAMNHSSVKKLTLECFSKSIVLDCHYPTDRVNFKYYNITSS